MERAVEADDAGALGVAGLGLRTADHLDQPFIGLGTGIAEESAVGKAVGDQPFGEAFGLWHAVQVGHVHHALRLFCNGAYQMWVVVSDRGCGDS